MPSPSMRVLLLATILTLLPAVLRAQAPDSSGAAPADTARVAQTPADSHEDLPGEPWPRRSPLMAGALSLFIFPGAGHVYAGEYETGGVIVGTIAASLFVATQYGIEEGDCTFVCPVNGVFLAGLGIAFGAAVYAHIDAPRAAARANRRHARARQASLSPALLGAPGGVRPGLTASVSL